MDPAFWNNLPVILAQLAPAADPLSGGAGWVGAGLLGCVLAWIMFIHLPAKDKQVFAMLDMQALEREKDRTARHDRANQYQLAITDVVNSFHRQVKEMQAEHERDADKDRQAFMARQENVRLAIEKQTLELEKAIRGSCQFIHPQKETH